LCRSQRELAGAPARHLADDVSVIEMTGVSAAEADDMMTAYASAMASGGLLSVPTGMIPAHRSIR
jgi:hypothetical protein